MVAYWPTRVHDHQTALKQSTAGGSYAMSTAWPSPENNPEFLRRTAASVKAGLAFVGESKERLRRVVMSEAGR